MLCHTRTSAPSECARTTCGGTRMRSLAWLIVGVLMPLVVRADEYDTLKVRPQPDGRIVVPTNQILNPAGEQVIFPGRPVDVAFAEDGKTLVVKNQGDLTFVDLATGKVKQALATPEPRDKKKKRVGFSVTGLVV